MVVRISVALEEIFISARSFSLYYKPFIFYGSASCNPFANKNPVTLKFCSRFDRKKWVTLVVDVITSVTLFDDGVCMILCAYTTHTHTRARR